MIYKPTIGIDGRDRSADAPPSGPITVSDDDDPGRVFDSTKTHAFEVGGERAAVIDD